MEPHKSPLNQIWSQSGKIYIGHATCRSPYTIPYHATSVRVTFVLFDSVTNQPLSALEALTILQNSNAQAALLSEDVQSSTSFEAGNHILILIPMHILFILAVMQIPPSEDDNNESGRQPIVYVCKIYSYHCSIRVRWRYNCWSCYRRATGCSSANIVRNLYRI